MRTLSLHEVRERKCLSTPRSCCRERGWLLGSLHRELTLMPLFLQVMGGQCFQNSGVNTPQIGDFGGSSLLHP